jgi:hypothetical protein
MSDDKYHGLPAWHSKTVNVIVTIKPRRFGRSRPHGHLSAPLTGKGFLYSAQAGEASRWLKKSDHVTQT